VVFIYSASKNYPILITIIQNVDIILTILHECSHVIYGDGLYVVNKFQTHHTEYLAECNKIKDYISLNTTEYGAPTTNIPALMESMHVFEKEVRKYYNSDGNPRNEWEIIN
jgi:ribosome-interacting GTPase 1